MLSSSKHGVLAPPLEPLSRIPLLVCTAAGLCLGDVLGGQVGVIGFTTLALAGVAGALLFLLTLQPAGRRLAVALIATAFGTAAAHQVYRPDFPLDHLAM